MILKRERERERVRERKTEKKELTRAPQLMLATPQISCDYKFWAIMSSLRFFSGFAIFFKNRGPVAEFDQWVRTSQFSYGTANI